MRKIILTILLSSIAVISAFTVPLAGGKFWLVYKLEYVYPESAYREQGLNCFVYGFAEYYDDGTYKGFTLDDDDNILRDEYRLSKYSIATDEEGFTTLFLGRDMQRNLIIELLPGVIMVIPEKREIDTFSAFFSDKTYFMVTEEAMSKYKLFSWAK